MDIFSNPQKSKRQKLYMYALLRWNEDYLHDIRNAGLPALYTILTAREVENNERQVMVQELSGEPGKNLYCH